MIRRTIRRAISRIVLPHGAGALLCLAPLAGCGSEPRAAPPATDASPVEVQDTAHTANAPTAGGAGGAVPQDCGNLHESILAVPPTRGALAAAFGAPDTVIVATEPNRHVPGAVDSLFSVQYAGFLMEIRTPTGARDMATHVEVEDNRYLAYPGIGIGASAERLEEVLGPPSSAGTDRLTWDCSEAVEQPVTFVMRDGRVSRIEIAYYVD